jgi:ParB family chromosome partitioning protein
MEKITFDINKLKVVDIELIYPNAWNPKDKNTLDFEKVKKSIEINGLRLPVVVREVNGKYEIIDGEQRYTSCLQLGYKKVMIYNEGELDDKTAKELTIWYQQQVPFNQLQLATLIKDLKVEFGDEIKLPFTDEEIEEFIRLDEFNLADYQSDIDPSEDITKGQEVTCPECGHIFTK